MIGHVYSLDDYKKKKKRWNRNWLQLIKLQCGEWTEDVQASSRPAGLRVGAEELDQCGACCGAISPWGCSRDARGEEMRLPDAT